MPFVPYWISWNGRVEGVHGLSFLVNPFSLVKFLKLINGFRTIKRNYGLKFFVNWYWKTFNNSSENYESWGSARKDYDCMPFLMAKCLKRQMSYVCLNVCVSLSLGMPFNFCFHVGMFCVCIGMNVLWMYVCMYIK